MQKVDPPLLALDAQTATAEAIFFTPKRCFLEKHMDRIRPQRKKL
jgi:hypothetical protein